MKKSHVKIKVEIKNGLSKMLKKEFSGKEPFNYNLFKTLLNCASLKTGLIPSRDTSCFKLA